MRQEPRAGAPVVHGSEPVESTRNLTATQRNSVAAVTHFAPWAGDDERALRVRVHRARDIAQARACRSKHGRARSVYWIAAQMAGDWVFARAPNDDLQCILETLSRLFLAAGAIERLEAPDE